MPAELECERWTSKSLNGLKLRPEKVAIFGSGAFYCPWTAIWPQNYVRFNAEIGLSWFAVAGSCNTPECIPWQRLNACLQALNSIEQELILLLAVRREVREP